MRPAALLVSALAAAGAAQDLVVENPPQQRPVVVRGGIIHTVRDGVIRDGALVFDQGRITHVLVARDAAAFDAGDAEVIDAGGRHVYPGMIGAFTSVGLVEVGSLRETIDRDEVGDANAELRAAVAFNPDSTAVPVTRVNGVLTVGVAPSGGLISGRLSVMSLAGWTWEDMTVRDDAGLVVAWPGAGGGRRFGRRGGGQPRPDPEQAIADLSRHFTAARAWRRAREADATVPGDLAKEGMLSAIDGDTPVLVEAEDLTSIERAVAWAADEGVRLVIVGGQDAWKCTDLLKRHDVAVIVRGTHRLPRRRDADYDEPFRLPALLEQAGLRWCLATDGSHSSERNLPYHAGTAIAHGLAADAALRAVTLSAAEILGVADRLGSLTVGKDATLFVCDGPPWEITTTVAEVWIAGRKIDQTSKHTELARKYEEKYRQLGR